MSSFNAFPPLATEIAPSLAAMIGVEFAMLASIKTRWPGAIDRCLRAGFLLIAAAALGVVLLLAEQAPNLERLGPWIWVLTLLMMRRWLICQQQAPYNWLHVVFAGALYGSLGQHLQGTLTSPSDLVWAVLVLGAPVNAHLSHHWCRWAATDFRTPEIRTQWRGRRLSRSGWRRLWEAFSGSGLAEVNAWTGLPQRQQLERCLAVQWNDRPPLGIWAMSLELGGIREVVHSYERRAADRLMREVLMRFEQACGPWAEVSRVGTEEFVVIAVSESPLSPAVIKACAADILEALQRPYGLPSGEVIELTCCIGMSVTTDASDPGSLLDHADAARQVAKTLGASGIAAFDPLMIVQQRSRHALRQDLKHAIGAGELSLYYQPKVACGTHAMVGVEALARWSHPRRGPISPAEFIALAESSGLIGELGDWVVLETCQQIRRWKAQGLQMAVALNLSAKQLQRSDLATRILGTASACGVEPSQLTFEITESVAMEDPEQASHIIGTLVASGATVALDDFGNGYSSLGTLSKLPIQQIKLDRSFVVELETSTQARAMVDSVIRLAHVLGQQVVAEGVETPGQVQILQALRCDQFQGYYFAKPMSPAALLQWLGDRSPSRGARATPLRAPTPIATPIAA